MRKPCLEKGRWWSLKPGLLSQSEHQPSQDTPPGGHLFHIVVSFCICYNLFVVVFHCCIFCLFNSFQSNVRRVSTLKVTLQSEFKSGVEGG